jgi:hypothetical protein
MPFFFCAPNAPRGAFRGRRIPYDEQPATDYWAAHFGDSLVLTSLAQQAPSPGQRAQARAELDLVERKMAHWLRHPNWDPARAGRLAARARGLAPLRLAAILEHLGQSERWRDLP